jgi:hypothetical protein
MGIYGSLGSNKYQYTYESLLGNPNPIANSIHRTTEEERIKRSRSRYFIMGLVLVGLVLILILEVEAQLGSYLYTQRKS